GTTPYVVQGLEDCRKNQIITGCITCNPNAPLSEHADYPIEVVTGPELVTGSTRMKAGTAQKLVLNMISTTVMIGLGRVKDNKMVDMQLSNRKLVERGAKMLVDELGIQLDVAQRLLQKNGSVRKVLELYKN
ncbi:MAG: N-acetylmuramic acid 6-phosphate etherase, partial [Saprospiraceae bacterium]